MNENTKARAECRYCNTPLPVDHKGPCPNCGKIGKNISVELHETISVTESLSWEKRKEFWEKNSKMMVLIWSITLISPILGWFITGAIGIIIGLILGIAVNLLGPYAVTKVREIERGKS